MFNLTTYSLLSGKDKILNHPPVVIDLTEEVEDQPAIIPDVEFLIQDRFKGISKEEEDATNKILSGFYRR
jgi:hypothetical protein